MAYGNGLLNRRPQGPRVRISPSPPIMRKDAEQKPPLTGKDILPINTIELSGHALSRFQMRTGLTLMETVEQMRGRLANATSIENHTKVKINKKKGKTSLYFQDSTDPDLVFVVDKKTKKAGYLISTILFPLRSTLRS